MTEFQWQRAVVLGGAGAVGSLFRRILKEHAETVLSLDLAVPSDMSPHIITDVANLTSEGSLMVEGADLVVWALPSDIAVKYLPTLVKNISASALFVETLSVQALPATLLRETSFEALGVNPLFAPSLPMEGRPVAVVTIRPGPQGSALVEVLESLGARVVPFDAADHDRCMSVIQAMTHAAVLALGAALSNSGTEIERLLLIAPPPHRTLLALLARIATGKPHVYFDVQHSNEYAAPAREALRRGMDTVAQAARDEQAFGDLIAQLRVWLGDKWELLAEECQQIFTRANT